MNIQRRESRYGSILPYRLFWLCALCLMFALMLTGFVGTPAFARAPTNSPQQTAVTDSDAYQTTIAYVSQFYPLWFTYYQSQFATINRLVGPVHISPIYQIVVAINNDTLYVSSFVDLSAQPVVLTIPQTTATYSLLVLDPYGDIIDSGIPKQTAGTYALTGPDYVGTLPNGVTQVPIPLNFITVIFRADKYSSAGVNEIAQAKAFRKTLRMQTLDAYNNNPSGGATTILPEVFFALPFKTAADILLQKSPIPFLKQLQVAVASSHTPPMSAAEQALSDHFNSLFGDGNFGHTPKDIKLKRNFKRGAKAAQQLILGTYLTHTGPTNWIHFTNIGQWGDKVVERSAITEYIQFGNGISTAAYYHTFKDATGQALNGGANSYVLTFPAGQIPQASRFWSVTAYTPEAIELVKNSANKYEVASYSPGLQTNPDGSISIYLATQLPSGVPATNWLPIPDGPFNLMLRVYGPKGSVANDTYVPPGVVANP